MPIDRLSLISAVIETLSIIAALYCIIKYIKWIPGRQKFTPEEASLRDKWVIDAFYKNAHMITKHRFLTNGEPVYTKRGALRAKYSAAAEQEYQALLNECFSGPGFSGDFCRFIHSQYPDIRRKDLVSAIAAYIIMREEAIDNSTEEFLQSFGDVTPEEFFKIKKKQTGDVVGVYIIHNETTGQYYVGQAKRVFFRIAQHFTGHGNGDIYADYKYGQDFSIKIIKLTESGYDDIDLLEKTMIDRYDAYTLGYNKTSGNGDFS